MLNKIKFTLPIKLLIAFAIMVLAVYGAMLNTAAGTALMVAMLGLVVFLALITDNG